MAVYEVGVYNEKVVEAVKQGEKHRDLDDSWADTNYFEVKAATEYDARRKMAAKYPERLGYVIASVSAVAERG
jgi:hypothetical protein